MSDVYILRAEFLREALGERSKTRLSSGKRTRNGVSAQARRCACKYQCTALAVGRVDFVVLESQDGAPSERKGGTNVCVD